MGIGVDVDVDHARSTDVPRRPAAQGSHAGPGSGGRRDLEVFGPGAVRGWGGSVAVVSTTEPEVLCVPARRRPCSVLPALVPAQPE